MESQAQSEAKTLPTKKDCSFTFKVEDVEQCTTLPQYLSTPTDLLKDIIDKPFKCEDWSHKNKPEACYIFDRSHGFINAVHTAYANHYPLKLSVSDFIILIGQGLSRHITSNAEKLRSNFVNHKGKATIAIRRDDLKMGQQNDWSTVFEEFAEKIKKNVKANIYDVVIDDTSVATKTTALVSQITLMDCMKDYYEYKVYIGCGIPQVTLKGTPEDWEKLRQKVRNLVELNKDNCLDLNWWLKHLVPVVEKICDSGSQRKVDVEFWSRIYKYREQYMVNIISGWVAVFFPYLSDREADNGQRRNPLDMMLASTELLHQISEVPLIWEDLWTGEKHDMKIYAGFLGAKFNEKTFTVKPDHFWSVIYADKKGSADENIRRKKGRR